MKVKEYLLPGIKRIKLTRNPFVSTIYFKPLVNIGGPYETWDGDDQVIRSRTLKTALKAHNKLVRKLGY